MSRRSAKRRAVVLVAVIAAAAGTAGCGSTEPDRRAQRMFSIYERYTSHFGHKLDRPFVKDRSDVGDVGTVCAYEHRPHNKQDAYFCTHMDIRLPAGQEVTGGFHAQIEEVAPKNVGLPYGCFGDALDEGQCDYLPGGQRATTLP